MLPAMAISLIRDFYGAIVHEMEQYHSGAVGLKSISTTLSHSIGLPILDNDVVIELRTAMCEREVVGSVWSGISLV